MKSRALIFTYLHLFKKGHFLSASKKLKKIKIKIVFFLVWTGNPGTVLPMGNENSVSRSATGTRENHYKQVTLNY